MELSKETDNKLQDFLSIWTLIGKIILFGGVVITFLSLLIRIMF